MTPCVDHGLKGDKDGYALTHRKLGGQRVAVRLHRLVFLQEHGYWPQLCRHKCDNPRCINPEHLEDGTPADNSSDMVKRGRSLRGEKHLQAKLTEADVDAIRKRYVKRSSHANSYTLAEEYGVSQHAIMRVLKHKSWNKEVQNGQDSTEDSTSSEAGREPVGISLPWD